MTACATDDDDDEPKLIQGNLNAFVQGSMYTVGCLCAKHVWLSARHHVPHAFVKWKEYRAILHMFNKDIKIFSADTLSCDIKDIYSLIKTWVAKLLQGIQRFKKAHTGVNLAEMISKSLREFSIVDRLLSLPGDNALNNVTMSRSLKGVGKLPSTHIAGPMTRILCAGHIFDLANKEEELLEELSSDRHDANEDAILEDLLEAVDNLCDLEEEDGNLGWNAIMKIFKLGHQIFNNGTMQQALRMECKNTGDVLGNGQGTNETSV
ncbi:uncharacterized protein ARMOST_19821 [Armillaria ostoyae]|uniref:Uncharacterized protein n=1 Tax=Armillaria ostoyae TaxID=47428 RepID=A0A284S5K9_ARMOS|nr:uncharacterized protein ARMOST_19821 [Armillaria ostoyae]